MKFDISNNSDAFRITAGLPAKDKHLVLLELAIIPFETFQFDNLAKSLSKSRELKRSFKLSANSLGMQSKKIEGKSFLNKMKKIVVIT